MQAHPAPSCPELEKAFARLRQEIYAGIRHGFFDLAVTCELIPERKRRLTIKAGKSYRFVISEQEVSD
mgnify:CR=1 FL=1